MAKFATVEALNTHLATRSYVTGYSLSEDDKSALAALTASPSSSAQPHAYRWALHISALTGKSVAQASAPASSASASKSAAAAPAVALASAAAADDMDDMFGGDDDVDEDGETAAEAAATVARQARMAAAKKLKDDKDAADGKTGAKKDKPVEKSLVVLEVKPWEADTDLEKVWKMICATEQEGLVWGQSYKLEPVAYGIMKLVMTCSIVDSLVLMDDVTDKIEALEEFVQSVQVASMNKI